MVDPPPVGASSQEAVPDETAPLDGRVCHEGSGSVPVALSAPLSSSRTSSSPKVFVVPNRPMIHEDPFYPSTGRPDMSNALMSIGLPLVGWGGDQVEWRTHWGELVFALCGGTTGARGSKGGDRVSGGAC